MIIKKKLKIHKLPFCFKKEWNHKMFQSNYCTYNINIIIYQTYRNSSDKPKSKYKDNELFENRSLHSIYLDYL